MDKSNPEKETKLKDTKLNWDGFSCKVVIRYGWLGRFVMNDVPTVKVIKFVKDCWTDGVTLHYLRRKFDKHVFIPPHRIKEIRVVVPSATPRR